MIETLNYNREIITGENKVLTVYLMLRHNQRVNHEILYDLFGCTHRTFNRIIATIRDSLEIVGIEGQVVYEKRMKSFILVRVVRK